MKKAIPVILLLFACVFPLITQAQKVWAFGDYAGIDFNSGSPVAIRTGLHGPPPAYSLNEGTATVCDNNGALLFATDGSLIWRSSGDLMPNGINITGLQPYYMAGETEPAYQTYSTTQAAVIVPIPDTPGKYYVFSLSLSNIGLGRGVLCYSVVDMSLDQGRGDVEPGRKGIFIDTDLSEKMTAVVGDRCNIWLLVHSGMAPAFKAFEITAAGINMAPVISTTGTLEAGYYTIGVMKCSPDRKRLLTCNEGTAELYDFDPVSGVVSNALPLFKNSLNSGACYGGSFSPGGSKIYTAEVGNRVYQYNLDNPHPDSIRLSRTDVGYAGRFADMKIGPDNKVYIVGPSARGVSVINFPDTAGRECNVVINAVTLLSGTRGTYSLPNEVAVLVRDSVRSHQEIVQCFKDDYTIEVTSAGWDYQWNGLPGSNTFIATASGTYAVSYYTPPCVRHADTFYLDLVGKLPALGAQKGCVIDSGLAWAVPAPGDTTAYTYSWYTSAGKLIRSVSNSTIGDTLFYRHSGDYILGIQARKGCDTSLPITILPPVPSPVIVADTILCEQLSVPFNCLPDTFVSYYWDFGDGNRDNSQAPSHIYAQPGAYTVMLAVRTIASCLDTSYLNVVVDTSSFVSFVSTKNEICEGESVSYIAKYPTGADTLLWTFSDRIADTVIGWQSVRAFDNSGKIKVTVTGLFRACPTVSFSDTILVNAYPVASIGSDTALCLNGNPLNLFASIANPAAFQYHWSTGDTTQATRATNYGIYTVSVTSDNGCTTSDSITIAKSCFMDIPNAFTPNGDGNNDYFFPRQIHSQQLKRFRMQVFSRWGQLLFETTSLDGRGWDGRFNGNEQTEGTYVYYIEAIFTELQQEQYKGNVTLLR